MTARELALRRADSIAHLIPPITDPLGRSWDQPSRFLIEVDETHALMSQAVLDRLKDYSCSMPSGVYPGKMWKCRVNYYDESKGWLLRWYGLHPDPAYVSNHQRRILVYDPKPLARTEEQAAKPATEGSAKA